MPDSLNQIAAVIVTYRREPELLRLLATLQTGSLVPNLVVVVDNAATGSTKNSLSEISLPTIYEPFPENPGPGAGWKRGMEIALQHNPAIAHFLVLDDDVVLPANAVSRLRSVNQDAAIVCPMLLDSHDHIWAFPEPQNALLRKVIRNVHTTSESISMLGTTPLPFVWCTGACVMISRNAVEAVGFHRTDFWMLGEDLEYSMRLAAHGGGLFLPDLFVPHLPPETSSGEEASLANQRKFDSLLQNLAYLSFHHLHSGHMKTYLPGNIRRYFRTFGWKKSSALAVLRAIWKGAVRKMPAGAK